MEKGQSDAEKGKFSNRLTQEQGGRLVELLNLKLGDRACEVCGADEFTINPNLASPLFLTLRPNGPSVADLSTSHPCVVSHCTNCGNTKLHSLSILGFEFSEWQKND